jgi:hypothetical protein
VGGREVFRESSLRCSSVDGLMDDEEVWRFFDISVGLRCGGSLRRFSMRRSGAQCCQAGADGDHPSEMKRYVYGNQFWVVTASFSIFGARGLKQAL